MRVIFPLTLLIALASSCLGDTDPAATSYPWQWQPWISVAGGHESDLVLDPEFTRTVVPGGYFMELAPGFRLARRLSPAVALRVLNRTTLERFANDDNRTLFGTQMVGEFLFTGESALRGRFSLTGDYFNDSGSASFRRYSGGGEIGVGYETTHLLLEVSGFLQGRTYPNVGVTVDTGAIQNYTEDHRGFSGVATWHPIRTLYLRAQVTGRNTDSLDPAFESTSVTATGSTELRLSPRIWFSAAMTTQSRDFSQRAADQDHDSYYQYGIGLGYSISHRVTLNGRYAYANYTYPLGETEDTQRFSLAATWQFGNKAPLVSRDRRSAPLMERTSPLRHSPVLVRVYAPDARQVSVAGSFNQWNPVSHPLQRGTAGWWELKLELSPGIHEYVYLVDGEAITPPDADRLVDDGFGGKNGVLEIVRPDR